jgi:hypothetical protein
VARNWLSIRVELVDGRGEVFWPRPGRVFAAAPTHTLADLGAAIDDAFARWDRSHLHQFWLPDGQRAATTEDWEDDCDEDEVVLDDTLVRLARLQLGDRFAYEFDLGDSWCHLCVVDEQGIDPLERLGIVPKRPLPYWGWGTLPDQYGRRWADDDGSGPPPVQPKSTDLPPLGPWQYLSR